MKRNHKTILSTLFLVGSSVLWGQNTNFEKATRLLPKIMTIDTHNHIDVPMEKSQFPAPRVDLRSAMKKAQLNGVCMTFAVDYVKLKYEGHAYERFLNALSAQDSVLQWSNIKRVSNGKDAKKAFKRGEPFAIQSVEGGHFLEGDITRLQVAYNRGVRVLGLLHDNDATPPLGDIYTNEPIHGGLTTFGAETIKECERLGILIDLAHCDNKTIDMALEVATKPVIITHTGLNTRLGTNEFMAKLMFKRLISPEQARKVANKGGVIGIWPHLSNSAKEYAQHIKAMIEIVGVDYVCIGTDQKLTPAYSEFSKEDMEKFQKQFEKETSNSGEKPQGKFKPKDPNAVNYVWNDEPDSFYHSVVRALLDEGFTKKEIAKICSGNFLRVFSQATQQ